MKPLEQFISEEEQHPLFAVSGMLNEECDHKGHYRLVNGLHAAIRFCTQCGKSWRMWVKPDFPGEMPVAEWEPIREGLEVEQRVLPDYDG